MTLGIQTTLRSLQSQALAVLPSPQSTRSLSISARVPIFQARVLFCSHHTNVVSLLQILDRILGPSLLYMDLFCWFWVVLFFTWLSGVSGDSMGRKLLSDIHGASPVFVETSFWDIIIYIWAIWAIIAILAISMARSKNIGKRKASSSSIGQAVKKRKSTPPS